MGREQEIKEIIIDLERSTYPNINHDNNELIQQEAIVELRKKMDKVVSFCKDDKTKYRPEIREYHHLEERIKNKITENDFMEYGHFRRRHNAIALLGERGTGKSNFLVNLQTILGHDDFVYLKILDPTLFEDRQNILVAILSQIKYIIQKAKDDSSKPYKSDSYEKYEKKWKSTLQRMAEGLNLIDDGIGNNPMKKDMWDDARLVLDKGLSASKAGYNFEKEFHIFLSYSVEMLDNINGFVLRLDDIDTNPEKGWNVLEVIRKYLTSPHLQIIISGDLELYSKIVRKKQWSHFQSLIDLDKDYDGQKKAVDDLEEQYLTKILQPENRIFLRTLRHIDNTEYDLVVKNKNGNPTKIEEYFKYIKGTEEIVNAPVKEVYRLLFKEVFTMPDNLIDYNVAMIMTLPLRTNIQILRELDKSISISDKSSIKLDDKKFMEGFSNVFLTVISKYDFSHRDFQKLFESSGYSDLVNKMYELSNKHKELAFNEMLIPQVVVFDTRLNIFLLFVHAYIAQSMNKNISRIFDWYYRVKLFNKLLEYYPEKKKFVLATRYMDIQKRISTYKVSIKKGGLFLEDERFLRVYAYERQNKNKNYHALDTFEKHLENKEYSIEDNKNLFIKFLLSIVLKKYKTKSTAVDVLTSVHYLFGFLANILNNHNIEDLPNSMSYLNTLNSFDKDKTKEENTNSRISYGDTIFTDKNSYLTDFIKELEDWKSFYIDGKVESFSLDYIDQCWDDFDSQINNLDETLNLSDTLGRDIFIFLNTLLRNMNQKTIYSQKPIKKSSIKSNKELFYQNVRRYYNKIEKVETYKQDSSPEMIINNIKQKEKISLFEFFLICPIWDYYTSFSYDHKDVNELNLFSNHEKNTTATEHTIKTFSSGVLQKLGVAVYDEQVIIDDNKIINYSNMDIKDIIKEKYHELDPDNLSGHNNSMYKLIKSTGKYSRVGDKIIDKWIKVYKEIDKEKDQ